MFRCGRTRDIVSDRPVCGLTGIYTPNLVDSGYPMCERMHPTVEGSWNLRESSRSLRSWITASHLLWRLLSGSGLVWAKSSISRSGQLANAVRNTSIGTCSGGKWGCSEPRVSRVRFRRKSEVQPIEKLWRRRVERFGFGSLMGHGSSGLGSYEILSKSIFDILGALWRRLTTL